MRNFLRIFKGSSLLNVLGMTVAFAALYILLVQVNYDLGYNKRVKDIERLYILVTPSDRIPGNYSVYTNRMIASGVLEQIPEAVDYGVAKLVGSDTKVLIEEGEGEKEYEICTSEFTLSALKLFNYEALQGSFEGMNNDNSVALSQSGAKLLGVSLGDVLKVGKSTTPRTVVAIYKDMFTNSDLDIDLIYCNEIENRDTDDTRVWGYNNFVKLEAGSDVADINNRIEKYLYSFVNEQYGGAFPKEVIDEYVKNTIVLLLPLDGIYFNKKVDSSVGRSGNKTTTYTLLVVAILILIITLVNFVNFFFAQVPARIRGVNTKKILGSSRTSLVVSFMVEAGILVLVSLAFAVAVVELFRSSEYANLISAPLAFGNNIFVIAVTVAVALLMTVASSVYPALYITSFPPTFALKGVMGSNHSSTKLRYSLIALQFVISIIFVICAWFVKLQHCYMMNYDMGFNKECLLTVSDMPLSGKVKETFESKLLNNPQIDGFAWSFNDMVVMQREHWGIIFKEKNIGFDVAPVSANFLQFMGIEIVEGRDFLNSDWHIPAGVFIFNETAKAMYGFTLEDKIGTFENHDADIIGFCKDFKFRSLQYEVGPLGFLILPGSIYNLNHLYFRTIENADLPSVIKFVRESIAELAPDITAEAVNVQFFDQELGEQYIKEQQLSKIVTLFTLLAIIISLMGVLGLVVFETQYRRKEIGIRRVHGATIDGILKMFNVRFTKILLVCMVVAAPISWYIMDYYYSSYALRAPLHWWVFLGSFALVALIVAVVVTLCSWKDATENPVRSLRSE